MASDPIHLMCRAP